MLNVFERQRVLPATLRYSFHPHIRWWISQAVEGGFFLRFPITISHRCACGVGTDESRISSKSKRLLTSCLFRATGRVVCVGSPSKNGLLGPAVVSPRGGNKVGTGGRRRPNALKRLQSRSGWKPINQWRTHSHIILSAHKLLLVTLLNTLPLGGYERFPCKWKKGKVDEKGGNLNVFIHTTLGWLHVAPVGAKASD